MWKVGIVIVNYNSGADLKECISRIDVVAGDSPNLSKVVVVDNDSTDSSLDLIPDVRFELLTQQMDENTGFGHACNVGAALMNSDVDAYLFLNPDVRLGESTLDVLAQELTTDNVGVVGVQNRDSDGKIRRTCARLPTPTRFIIENIGISKLMPKHGVKMIDWSHNEDRNVDHVIGGCYCIDENLFHEVGGFDDQFFVYYEDVDLSKRVLETGHSIKYSASGAVVHPPSGPTTASSLALSLEARIQYARKHFTWLGFFATVTSIVALELPARLIRAVVLGGLNEVREIISAYIEAAQQVD